MNYEIIDYDNKLNIVLDEKIQIVNLETNLKNIHFNDIIGFYRIDKANNFNRFFIEFNKNENIGDLSAILKKIKYIEGLLPYQKKKLGVNNNNNNNNNNLFKFFNF